MASNSKAVAAMILVNLVMFAFVSANATYLPGTTTPCPTLDICASIPLVGATVTLGSQARTPCCGLLGNLVAANAQVCICTGIVGSLLGSTLAPLLGLPLVGGLLGSTLSTANLNTAVAVLINACDLPTFTCA